MGRGRGEIGGRDGRGVAPLPRISSTDQPAQPYLGVEALMMSARSVRKAEAFKVMRALTTDEAAYTDGRMHGSWCRIDQSIFGRTYVMTRSRPHFAPSCRRQCHEQ